MERREVATASANLTVAEWLEEWLETGRTLGWSPLTYTKREAAIRNTIIPALGAIRLRQLERRHIQQWVRSLAEAGYGR